ncbi:MAG TPA: hypothetical protein VMF90_08755 [Rhizobiaceae bacterium]|nr:hypothetical protein [Rhizobiaceae bacterium]
MKLFALTIATIALFPATAKAGPDTLGECYDLAILECGLVYGDQDYGDDGYYQCVNEQFDLCDDTFGDKRRPNGSFKAPQSTKPLRLKAG